MISRTVRLTSRKSLIALAMAMLSVSALWAGQWTALGPDGGDVRSLSYDPQNPDRIFLGTSTGTLFLSADGGHNWSRLAHLGGDDYVLDHIVIDPQNPKHIYVSAWSVENQQAGDVFRSHDGGKNWEALPGMHGKSVRALAIAASRFQGPGDRRARRRVPQQRWRQQLGADFSRQPGRNQEHRIDRG